MTLRLTLYASTVSILALSGAPAMADNPNGTNGIVDLPLGTTNQFYGFPLDVKTFNSLGLPRVTTATNVANNSGAVNDARYDCQHARFPQYPAQAVDVDTRTVQVLPYSGAPSGYALQEVCTLNKQLNVDLCTIQANTNYTDPTCTPIRMPVQPPVDGTTQYYMNGTCIPNNPIEKAKAYCATFFPQASGSCLNTVQFIPGGANATFDIAAFRGAEIICGHR